MPERLTYAINAHDSKSVGALSCKVQPIYNLKRKLIITSVGTNLHSLGLSSVRAWVEFWLS